MNVLTALGPVPTEPTRRRCGTAGGRWRWPRLAVLATFLDTTVLFVAFPDIVRTFSDGRAPPSCPGC